MTNFHSISSIQANSDTRKISVIFGGTFDPIHEGHIKDIKSILTVASTLIIAPTIQNPWKDKSPTDIVHRVEMISLALMEEHINHHVSNKIKEDGIYIFNYPYTFSIELLAYVKKFRENPYWAIGEDLIESASQWKNWNSEGTDFIVLPLLNGFSSTKIRDQSLSPLSSIKDYIKINNLYK